MSIKKEDFDIETLKKMWKSDEKSLSQIADQINSGTHQIETDTAAVEEDAKKAGENPNYKNILQQTQILLAHIHEILKENDTNQKNLSENS